MRDCSHLLVEKCGGQILHLGGEELRTTDDLTEGGERAVHALHQFDGIESLQQDEGGNR